MSTSVGDEGGFAPKLKGTEDALETILSAINIAGYKPGIDINIALDCASSEFFKNNKNFNHNLMFSFLGNKKIAFDIAGYRNAKPGIRVWNGSNIKKNDLIRVLDENIELLKKIDSSINFKINNKNGKKQSKSFNAKVVEKSFMGDTMLYGINLGENDHHTYRISISDIKNTPSPNIGEEISVYFQEDDIVAYFEE